MTLVYLWSRYQKDCTAREVKPYQYRQFCELYARWCNENYETLHIQAVIARKMEVDFAGKTFELIDSIDGAKSSAIIYSITETAKTNNLNPFRYLDYVLTVLKDHQDDTDYSFIEELLPWLDQLPEICRSKSKTTNL